MTTSRRVLRQRQRPPFRLDLSALTPERLAGMSAGEVERLPLRLGRHAVALADCFAVDGEAGELLVLETDGDAGDRIGAGMSRGEIRVDGDAGAYLGLGASGGRITVTGGCGPFCASGLSGGAIEIGGDAGEFLGAALPGEHVGMRGGTVRVRGGIGARAADHMRRGLIVVEGGAGDYAGARMGGGTLVLAGPCGTRPGYAMRRGTILCLGPAPLPGPTFNDCGRHRLGFLRLVERAWQQAAPDARLAGPARQDTLARRWVGDLGFGGQGEVLHWQDGAT